MDTKAFNTYPFLIELCDTKKVHRLLSSNSTRALNSYILRNCKLSFEVTDELEAVTCSVIRGQKAADCGNDANLRYACSSYVNVKVVTDPYTNKTYPYENLFCHRNYYHCINEDVTPVSDSCDATTLTKHNNAHAIFLTYGLFKWLLDFTSEGKNELFKNIVMKLETSFDNVDITSSQFLSECIDPEGYFYVILNAVRYENSLYTYTIVDVVTLDDILDYYESFFRTSNISYTVLPLADDTWCVKEFCQKDATMADILENLDDYDILRFSICSDYRPPLFQNRLLEGVYYIYSTGVLSDRSECAIGPPHFDSDALPSEHPNILTSKDGQFVYHAENSLMVQLITFNGSVFSVDSCYTEDMVCNVTDKEFLNGTFEGLAFNEEISRIYMDSHDVLYLCPNIAKNHSWNERSTLKHTIWPWLILVIMPLVL